MLEYQQEKQTIAIKDLAAAILGQPTMWLNTPHAQLGGLCPQELVDTSAQGEKMVRDLLLSIQHGMPT